LDRWRARTIIDTEITISAIEIRIPLLRSPPIIGLPYSL
jgi:hypothetical protein